MGDPPDPTGAEVWDVATGRCNTTLEGHRGWVCSLTGLDGQFLLSGSADATVKVPGMRLTLRRCSGHPRSAADVCLTAAIG